MALIAFESKALNVNGCASDQQIDAGIGGGLIVSWSIG